MHHLIGKTQPGRSRPEMHHLLPAVLLVIEVRLGAVVKSQHQVIVFAACTFGDVQKCQHRARAGERSTYPRQKGPGHRLETFTDPPDAIFACADIREYTQNALAVIRSRWKSVDVKPRVVFSP